MIRVEGIPIVAARLAAAQKAKTIKARKAARNAARMAAGAEMRMVGSAQCTGLPNQRTKPKTDTKESMMIHEQYDIITVGGGLGGSVLAKAMAEQGKRVLVLEREKQFRD